MPVTLPPLLPPTRSGRTFFVAAALLGAVAGAQLVALGVHLAVASKHPVVAVSAPAPAPSAVPQAAPAPAALPSPALAATPAPPALTLPEPAAAPSIARPTPAAVERSAGSLADLLEQARGLRQSGDTNSALARLRDAQAIAPENPMIVAETALTYEGMGLNDRAFEQWQRLYDMGETIGALYYMAEARIHKVAPTGAAPPPAAPESTGASDGFQENAVLKITSLTLDELKDPAAEKKLSLKIAVKNKPGFMVDPRRVKIEARFYDQLDGKEVVITNAVTGFAWLTSPVNWANDETEILQTTYLRPKIDPAAAAAAVTPTPTPPPPTPTPAPRSRRGRHAKSEPEPTPAGAPAPPAAPAPAPVRTYLGYSVCLYYNGQLQDQQAVPLQLLQQFPPPLTLSSE